MHNKIDKDGYVLIYLPSHLFSRKDGYILEHRVVMEKNLKRYLKKEEVVHHRNEIKDDNNIENLQLMTFSEHRRLHTKGVCNPMFSRNHTEETKKIISIKNKGKGIGKKATKQAVDKMSILKKEYWNTHERPFGIKNPMFGKKRTDEERRLISIKTKEGMKKSRKWKLNLERRTQNI